MSMSYDYGEISFDDFESDSFEEESIRQNEEEPTEITKSNLIFSPLRPIDSVDDDDEGGFSSDAFESESDNVDSTWSLDLPDKNPLLSAPIEENRIKDTVKIDQQTTRNTSAILIQRITRGQRHRKHHTHCRKSALTIQTRIRGHNARKQIVYKKKQIADKIEQDEATICIQAFLRGGISRRKTQQLMKQIQDERMNYNNAATCIQAVLRGQLKRREIDKLVLKLQENSHKDPRLQENSHKDPRHEVSFEIQHAARDKQCMSDLKQLDKDQNIGKKEYQASKTIQKVARGRKARKRVKQKKERNVEIERASKTIQKVARGRKARKHHIHCRKSALTIQARIRGHNARKQIVYKKKQIADKIEQDEATICIQAFLRGDISRRKTQQLMKQMQAERTRNNNAATCIQSALRGEFGRQQARDIASQIALEKKRILDAEALQQQLVMTESSIIIQTFCRGYISRKKVHLFLQRRKDVADARNNLEIRKREINQQIALEKQKQKSKPSETNPRGRKSISGATKTSRTRGTRKEIKKSKNLATEKNKSSKKANRGVSLVGSLTTSLDYNVSLPNRPFFRLKNRNFTQLSKLSHENESSMFISDTMPETKFRAKLRNPKYINKNISHGSTEQSWSHLLDGANKHERMLIKSFLKNVKSETTTDFSDPLFMNPKSNYVSKSSKSLNRKHRHHKLRKSKKMKLQSNQNRRNKQNAKYPINELKQNLRKGNNRIASKYSSSRHRKHYSKAKNVYQNNSRRQLEKLSPPPRRKYRNRQKHGTSVPQLPNILQKQNHAVQSGRYEKEQTAMKKKIQSLEQMIKQKEEEASTLNKQLTQEKRVTSKLTSINEKNRIMQIQLADESNLEQHEKLRLSQELSILQKRKQHFSPGKFVNSPLTAKESAFLERYNEEQLRLRKINEEKKNALEMRKYAEKQKEQARIKRLQKIPVRKPSPLDIERNTHLTALHQLMDSDRTLRLRMCTRNMKGFSKFVTQLGNASSTGLVQPNILRQGLWELKIKNFDELALDELIRVLEKDTKTGNISISAFLTKIRKIDRKARRNNVSNNKSIPKHLHQKQAIERKASFRENSRKQKKIERKASFRENSRKQQNKSERKASFSKSSTKKRRHEEKHSNKTDKNTRQLSGTKKRFQTNAVDQRKKKESQNLSHTRSIKSQEAHDTNSNHISGDAEDFSMDEFEESETLDSSKQIISPTHSKHKHEIENKQRSNNDRENLLKDENSSESISDFEDDSDFEDEE